MDNSKWTIQGLVVSVTSLTQASISRDCVGLANGCLCTSQKRIDLIVQIATQGADKVVFLSSSTSPDMTSLSSSVCRAMKWFCKGTSDFGGSVFLLQVVAIASFDSSALLLPPPSTWATGGVFGCLAASCEFSPVCPWNQLS